MSVIGSGTAGLVAAADGASLGAKIARDKLGGGGLDYGCAPTKASIRSAGVAFLMRRASEFGTRPFPVEVDFQAVMGRMRAAMENASERNSPERSRSVGVNVRLGEGLLRLRREVSRREAAF